MFMPTVYEDMIFGPLNYGKSRKEADQLAREALEELDLIHLKDRQNYKMSGGEKRIAAIATILAMNPKVMLMDEPSTALDPKNRRRLIRILAEKSSVKCFVEISLLFVKENCFFQQPWLFFIKSEILKSDDLKNMSECCLSLKTGGIGWEKEKR